MWSLWKEREKVSRVLGWLGSRQSELHIERWLGFWDVWVQSTLIFRYKGDQGIGYLGSRECPGIMLDCKNTQFWLWYWLNHVKLIFVVFRRLVAYCFGERGKHACDAAEHYCCEKPNPGLQVLETIYMPPAITPTWDTRNLAEIEENHVTVWSIFVWSFSIVNKFMLLSWSVELWDMIAVILLEHHWWMLLYPDIYFAAVYSWCLHFRISQVFTNKNNRSYVTLPLMDSVHAHGLLWVLVSLNLLKVDRCWFNTPKM